MKRRRRQFSLPEISELWALTFMREVPEAPMVERVAMPRPTRLLIVSLGSVALLLILRLGQLTLVEGSQHRVLSDGNRIRAISLPAPRGVISSRDGTALVRNVPAYDLAVTTSDLPRDPTPVLERIQSLSGVPVAELRSKLDSRSSAFAPVVVADGVTQEVAIRVQADYAILPGVTVRARPERNYLYGPLYAHLLGYTGRIDSRSAASFDETRYDPGDAVGKTGLEARYEDQLHGSDGARQVEVDSHGRPVHLIGEVTPAPGSDLTLAVDHRLQTQMTSSLQAMLEKSGATGATGVALDPRSGAVLAYVSLPAYDPGAFSRGISQGAYDALLADKRHPLLDRPLTGTYPPGSTIKPFIAAAALDAGTITPGTTINGPASITVGGAVFPDWRTQGPGINLQRAIALSSDVYFYGVGGGFDIAGVGAMKGLGIERLAAGLSRFAFGQPTGIDLPGEGSGVVPSPEWKSRVKSEPWYLGDTYHASIGQGDLSVTPLQLVTSLVALANGGTLYRPYVVSRISTPGQAARETHPKVIRSGVYPASTLATIRSAMRETVTEGTARPLQSLPVEVAGKTGTAEYGLLGGRTHAWFESFAPYSSPTIAMVIMIEGGGESFDAAVPVAGEIYRAYFAQP